VLAALGPKMLDLAAQRTAGAHPYFVPVDHTEFARRVLGPGPLLAPEQAVVVTDDAREARAIARVHACHYLALDNYRNNLLRLGWSDEDVAGDGSDELIDGVVAWGSIDDIQARVAAHLEAGADHVCVQVLNGLPDRFALDELRRLAPALLEL
jgi:probable F420-dependent oxidoreductase